MKRTGPILAGFALGIALLLAGCGASGLGPVATAASQTDPTSGTAAPVRLSKSTPMGDTATSANWSITVKDAVRRPQAGGVSAASGKQLVVILFWWKNLSKQDQHVGIAQFTLADKGGTVYPAAPTTGPGFISTLSALVKPGSPVCPILVAYEVPTGVGPFTWTYNSAGASSGAAPEALLEVK